ncbi:MAG: hypothetical protein QM679_08015 [Patulibacter sp.]
MPRPPAASLAGWSGASLLALSGLLPWEATSPAAIPGMRLSTEAHRPVVLYVVLALATVAALATLRATLARSLAVARSQAPLLAASGCGALAAGALELWVLSPPPAGSPQLALGGWLLGAAGLLLLGSSATIGRRVTRSAPPTQTPPPRATSGDGVSFSHGAWVPRGPIDSGR